MHFNMVHFSDGGMGFPANIIISEGVIFNKTGRFKINLDIIYEPVSGG